MSLKTFHIVFIVFAIALCAGLGAWGIRGYLALSEMMDLVLGMIGVISSLVLMWYAQSVIKKYRDIGFM